RLFIIVLRGVRFRTDILISHLIGVFPWIRWLNGMITSRYNDEVFSEGIIVATKMWMIRGDGGKLYDDFSIAEL
ncbi:hypothetical protein ACNDDY_004998, partial [Escherichia coli]